MFHHPKKDEAPHIVIAFYHLVTLADPDEEVRCQKAFLADCDVTCRVYISDEGVNAQMCFSQRDAERYMAWLQSRPLFEKVIFKLQGATQHVFPRVSVKKRSLVAMGEKVSLEERGHHLRPTEWRKVLEEEQDIFLIDVRNKYEWDVGHFEGAECIPYDTFRDAREYARNLKERIKESPKKILMYCTGGIRCEYFSALLMKEGITDIYQLDGGVIGYGEAEGAKKWKGSLFVFDDRLTVPVGEGSEEVIGACHSCQKPTDVFYNCANMDCNALFVSCPECLEKLGGCCKEACLHSPRVRPFKFVHTPFRRWYNYAKTRKDLQKLHSDSQAS